MEWIGIQNENEYYSAYFLSEGLADSLKDQLNTWKEDEAKRHAEAEARGEKSWRRTPGQEIRSLCKTLLKDMEEARKIQNTIERIEAERKTTARLLNVLGLPAADPSKDPFYPAGQDHLPLPLLGALYREGKRTEPIVWVFEATPTIGPDVVQSADTDPLEMFVQTEQFTDLKFDLPASAQKDLSDNWNRILEKRVFSAEYAPRWVILASPEHWLLIDRTKFNRHSVLRFDWKEIFSRREERVIDVCAALLSAESMTGRDGATALLDHVDEDAHKQAYGVSESLKKSLRRAIELLGNEAANQIIERSRQQKGKVKRDAAFANELTVECLRYMYRILFLLFIEARPDLKYAPIANDVYQSGYAFEGLREIESRPLLTDEDRNGRFFNDSINLLVTFFANGTNDKPARHAGTFDDVVRGTNQIFRITAFKGSLFDLLKTPNLNKVVFTNETLQQVVRLMSLSDTGRGRGRRQGRGRISYAHLGIHQLGAVYEALLSYRGFFAQEDLYEVSPDPSKRDEFEAGYFVTKAEIDSGHYTDDQKVFETNDFGERALKVYPKETFIYRLTGREREKSASYYTPEILTQCLVKYVLKEYWETVIDKLPDDKAKAERILKLKVAEPALGSATFLNEAINQLAAKYMEHAQRAAGERLSQEKYNEELQRVKMYLADNNVFGVDLNPVAVELAQVSLWLNALSSDKFVPWFGLQLQCGNSLIGCRRRVCMPYQDEKNPKKWSFHAPHELTNRDRNSDEVWQFLLPDPDMINYANKDMKAVYSRDFKELAEKRKAFTKAFTKDEVTQLQQLSAMVDQHWDAWAEELADIRKSTTDPYDIYGHKAESHEALSYEAKNALTEATRVGDGSLESGHFTRLLTAMNYWCSLWFWPIKKANSFPSRADFIADMGAILASEVYGIEKLVEPQPTDLFSALEDKETESLAEDDSGSLLEAELDANPRLHIAREVADRLRFFHWPLRFADILYKTPDGSPTGFDITLGNPPWLVNSWNSGEVIGDFLPFILFDKMNASSVRDMLLNIDNNGVRWIEKHKNIETEWRTEFERITGGSNYLKSPNNFPETQNSATDLFKWFLPVSWSNSKNNGIQGFVHPLTNFNEVDADSLRAESYRRMRLLFLFKNELLLFHADHHIEFALTVYGSKVEQKDINAHAIVNLFDPRTIDETFASDGSGEVEGLKDTTKKWVVRGHKERLLEINDETLRTFGQIFHTSQSTPVFPKIHCESLIHVLQKFIASPFRLKDIDGTTISMMWNQSDRQKDGTIAEYSNHRTHCPLCFGDLILNGPHIYLANPVYKCPQSPCEHNSAWTPIDLESISDSYIPRHKFFRNISEDEYDLRDTIVEWSPKPFNRHYKLCYRSYVSLETERTLVAAIYPGNVSFINKIQGIVVKRKSDLSLLLGILNSLPIDFYIRMLGKTDLLFSVICGIPLPIFTSEEKLSLFVRALGLNCL